MIRFGLAGGALLILCKSLLVIGWRGVASGERDSHVLKGSLSFWLTVFIAGGVAEALWQAVCISSLLKNDSGTFLAALLTAIPFTLAHTSGRPSRIVGPWANVGAEAIIGFVLGLIFIWSVSLFSVWIASMIYTVSNFSWLRWRYGHVQA
jgi:membrane protease YdiL (CAAX protease family)